MPPRRAAPQGWRVWGLVLAESSARMASGAINTATNAMGTAANVGSNVAQNVASAAAQAPAARRSCGDDGSGGDNTGGRRTAGWWCSDGDDAASWRDRAGPGEPGNRWSAAGGPNVGGATPTTPAARAAVWPAAVGRRRVRRRVRRWRRWRCRDRRFGGSARTARPVTRCSIRRWTPAAKWSRR